MQYSGNQPYDLNNVRVKRMALRISLFNHEHENRCFEASLSVREGQWERGGNQDVGQWATKTKVSISSGFTI